MKCPHCGTENLSANKSCARCGRPLGRMSLQSKDPVKPGSIYEARPAPVVNVRTVGSDDKITAEDVASKMKSDYRRIAMEQPTRALEIFQTLLAHLRSREVDLKGLMEKAAKMIHQQLRIRWVAIGLKSKADGKFRYEVLVGFKDEAANARKQQAFDLEDIIGDRKYIGRMLSEHTKLFLEEDKPYTSGAEITFNRPILINSKRREIDDALEADYLDIRIYGINKEFNGWIEISGTTMGKLPDPSTLRIVEVIADILAEGILRSQGNRYLK